MKHRLKARASNSDEIGVFFNGIYPYLKNDTVRGFFAAHGAHHVLQINQYKRNEYASLKKTWTMIREHVYVIADTLRRVDSGHETNVA